LMSLSIVAARFSWCGLEYVLASLLVGLPSL
jgi:hypothetical protein